MTIKEELKEKLQKARETEAKRNEEAKKLIEEFIIPHFREIAEIFPLKSYMEIKFLRIYERIGYKSIIDSKRKLPYSYDTVCKAATVAKEYDIQAVISCDGGEIVFSLDLE